MGFVSVASVSDRGVNNFRNLYEGGVQSAIASVLLELKLASAEQ